MACIISFNGDQCLFSSYPLVAIQELKFLSVNSLNYILCNNALERELLLLKDCVSLHILMQKECERRLAILSNLPVHDENYALLNNKYMERRSWQTIAASTRLDAIYNFKYALDHFSSYFKKGNFPNVKIRQIKRAIEMFSERFAGDMLARNADKHRADRIYGNSGRHPISEEKIARKTAAAKSDNTSENIYYYTYVGSTVGNDVSWNAFTDIYRIYLMAVTSLPLNTDFHDFPREILLQYIDPENLEPKPVKPPPATPPPSASPR